MTREEVHKIAPSLKKAAEMKTPFQVPLGYFEEIESRVESQIQLQEISSDKEFSTPETYFESFEDIVIAKLKAEVLFKDNTDKSVPSDYFDSLEDEVMERLRNEDVKPKSQVISWHHWKKLGTPLAAAAAIALLIILGTKQQGDVTFENLALSEIEYALESNFLEFDSETLLTVFPEVAASFENINLELSEETLLENYLYETDLSNILYE